MRSMLRLLLTGLVQPLMMADKWIEVSPKDIIWDNIDVSLITS